MKFKFHNHFKKAYLKLPKRIKEAVNNRLLLFEELPFEFSLKNHALTGKYKNYRSINITGDYRAIYKVVVEDEVIFVKIGTHSELYG